MDKESMFLIGEISNIFEIPIPTLRYYDEIGLLKPAYKDDFTGYRYYSLEQFKNISLIRYLKNSGVPLNDIKKILSELSPENYVKLLIQQKERMTKELDKLTYTLDLFNNRINEIEDAIDIDNYSDVMIKEFPARKIIFHEEQITSRTELERAIRKLESKVGYIVDTVGLTMSYEDLISGNYNTNNSIYVVYRDESIVLKEGIDSKYLIKGYYACMYCNALQKNSLTYYNKLLNYIKDSGYQLAREDSIRKIIIDTSIVNNENSYLAEIQIPIIK